MVKITKRITEYPKGKEYPFYFKIILDYISDQIKLRIGNDLRLISLDITNSEDVEIQIHISFTNYLGVRAVQDIIRPLSYKIVERYDSREQRYSIRANIDPRLGYQNDDYLKKVLLAKLEE